MAIDKATIDGSYLVSFSEPPLAAFRGFDGDADPRRAALKATSPSATGEQQLDVHSPVGWPSGAISTFAIFLWRWDGKLSQA